MGDEILAEPDLAAAEATPDHREASPLDRARARGIWRMLCDSAGSHGASVALVASDAAGDLQRLTYAALVERVRDLSAGLASIGVRHGDRVAIWMTNSLEWVVSAFAVMRLGAVLVPVNTFLKPPEVAHFLRASGARHLIMLDRFRKLEFAALLAGIAPEFAAAATPGLLSAPSLPDLRNVVIFHRAGGSRDGAFDLLAIEALGRTDAAARHLADAIAAGVRPDDLGMIKYTSGSTGFPKGAMLEQCGIVANGVLHSQRMQATAADVYFSMMPFFHAGGSIYGLMTMLVNGGRLVFTEAYDAALGVSLAAREGATIVLGMLASELEEAGAKLGVTCPATRIASGFGLVRSHVFPNASLAFQAFGLTETYGPAAMWSPDDPAEKAGTCGRELPGYECRVVDPATGRDVPAGTVGEAWVRGNIMRGYWNAPEETARALTADGWLRTEDLVRRDADGYLSWVGRMKLMLKVGGENVSLEEVERVAATHDEILDTAAIGVTDPRKGEAVGLLVVRREACTLCEADLTGWLSARMAAFKLPRRIAFVADLPRLGNGKLDRTAIVQLASATFQD